MKFIILDSGCLLNFVFVKETKNIIAILIEFATMQIYVPVDLLGVGQATNHLHTKSTLLLGFTEVFLAKTADHVHP